ncbi:MAG: hypothetical protein C4543_05515 [Ignavibacteriales bacterium]|jgi:hypothetical protein|nr:MAG: hypothetical protein C4543_05515 [Ignavibacteriales bacterium]
MSDISYVCKIKKGDTKVKVNNRINYYLIFLVLTPIFFLSCQDDKIVDPVEDNPESKIYKLPVVIHILHKGEPIGEGFNLSKERIERQVEILNEDYRKREGTRGYNKHPDGGDSKIEFVLAKKNPVGDVTDGIVRVNIDSVDNPTNTGSLFDYYAYYSYWNPENYINIWTMPLDESMINIVLGMATGPETELPGADLLAKGEPYQAEGILINTYHFGESEINSNYNLGRTLTHEMGHYLGVLHLWGGGDCENNDFCDDTPPISEKITGCSPDVSSGCDEEPVMFNNYMTWSNDICMNIFTNDQISRMHYVLENSARRKTLQNSIGLSD